MRCVGVRMCMFSVGEHECVLVCVLGEYVCYLCVSGWSMCACGV